MCPYFIEDNACIIKEAQKYDLNYIRRYYRYLDTSVSPNVWKIANSGNKAVSDTSPYINYPLIIEYNPLVQTSPPPLFSR
jgi:uncharacterized protein YfaT (DUF1175 family)